MSLPVDNTGLTSKHPAGLAGPGTGTRRTSPPPCTPGSTRSPRTPACPGRAGARAVCSRPAWSRSATTRTRAGPGARRALAATPARRRSRRSAGTHPAPQHRTARAGRGPPAPAASAAGRLHAARSTGPPGCRHRPADRHVRTRRQQRPAARPRRPRHRRDHRTTVAAPTTGPACDQVVLMGWLLVYAARSRSHPGQPQPV